MTFRLLLAIMLMVGGYFTCGIDRAQAAQQCAYPGNGSWEQCDQGTAFLECAGFMSASKSYLAANPAGPNAGGPGSIVDACVPIVQGSGARGYRCSYRAYGAGPEVNCLGSQSALSAYPINKTCGKRDPYTGVGPWSTDDGKARSGSVACDKGCDGAWFSSAGNTMTFFPTGDTCPEDQKKRCETYGEGHYWNALLKVCEPPDGKCPNGEAANSLGKCAPEPCPAGKVLQQDGTCKSKESECPAGNVKSPDGACLPGDGQCAEGEVRGKDGTCKRDEDGDGEPDEGEDGEGGEGDKDTFSGGDDCKTPPSCSGSAILCGQARIQWRIDCNTRKNRNVAGGTCSAQPVCTGEKCDALEYSGLLMQWRTACAAEKMAQNGGTGDSGLKEHLTAMKKAEVDALRALGQDDGHGNVDPSKMWGKANLDDKINEGLFGGGGGTCDLSFTIGGNVVVPPPQFWRIIQIIHWLMVASAYLWVSFQLSK